MQPNLVATYLHFRRNNPAMSASRALDLARAAMESGKGKGYRPAAISGPYNPAHDWLGYKSCRWVENVGKAGLRFVGYADDILNLRHSGWIADAFGDESYRGAVWQLPARDGRPCLVYGYEDPCNAGAAHICFDPEWGADGEAGGRYGDATREAARMADGMAESFAEQEREYQQAWQAARQWEEARDDMRKNRQSARALVQELRAARRAGATAGAAVCKALRERLAAYASEWAELREQRDELAGNFWWQSADGERFTIERFAAAHL